MNEFIITLVIVILKLFSDEQLLWIVSDLFYGEILPVKQSILHLVKIVITNKFSVEQVTTNNHPLTSGC